MVTNQFKSSRSGSQSLTMVIPSGSMMERAMVAWLEHGRNFVSGPLAATSTKLLAPPHRDDTQEEVRPSFHSPALTRRRAREKHGEASVAHRTRRQTGLRGAKEVKFTGQDSDLSESDHSDWLDDEVKAETKNDVVDDVLHGPMLSYYVRDLWKVLFGSTTSHRLLRAFINSTVGLHGSENDVALAAAQSAHSRAVNEEFYQWYFSSVILFVYHMRVNHCRTRSLVTGAKYAASIPSSILKLTAAPVPNIFQGNMPRPAEVWDSTPQLVANLQAECTSSTSPVRNR